MTSFWPSTAVSPLKCLSLAMLLSGAMLLSPPGWALDIQVTGLKHADYPTPTGDLVPGDAPATFTYIVNEDNTADPFDPNPLNHPGVAPMPSHSHVVAAGDQDHATIVGSDGQALPGNCLSPHNESRPCKYFVSVRAPGYKLWGQHFTVHQDGHVTIPRSAPLDPLTVTTLDVALIQEPLPLSNLVIKIFEDFAPVNGFPDFPLEIDDTGAATSDMSGFRVVIEDIFGQVSVDFNGNPICGNGQCFTNAAGDLTIHDLGFGKYDVHVIPPTGNPQQWVQSSTFEGTRGVDAWLEEGSDGLGAPREILAEPFVQTAHFFGFTRAMAAPGGPGSVTGRVRNYVEFPPFAQLALGEPVNRPWITLTDIGNTDTQILRARGNADGTFNITGIPVGTYQMAIWDDPLDYIMGFYNVTIAAAPGITNVNMGDLGVFRWFGWLSGTVFFDNDCTIIGGEPSPTDADCGIKGPNDPGVGAFDMDIRARDGTVPYATVTNSAGRYEFPEAISPLGKFLIGEVGFGRFGLTGQSVHNELCSNLGLNPSAGCTIANRTKVPGDLGGNLLTNQLLLESHRSIVDWGKRNYATNETGQIVGITFYDTTRNELDARLAAAEEYQPAIPGVLVRLWGRGADAKSNTSDDVLLNEYITDAWQHPTGCDVRDKNGAPVPGATPTLVANNCIEVPQLGNETKDGAFDGGYAFAATCPLTTGPSGGPILAGPTLSDTTPAVPRHANGDNVPAVPTSPPGTNPFDIDGDGIPNTYDTDRLLTDEQLESCEIPLTPRDYVVQVVAPPYYQITAEEDVNVDEGSALVPAVLPPPCVGDLHTVNDTGGDIISPYNGTNRPLCDKRQVTLAIRQNANSDFFLFTDMDTNPWTKIWSTDLSVPPAGRFFGLIEDDLDINTDPNSITYGEKRPVEGAPVGVRDYTFRKLTTVYADEYAFYDVMVPSTFTANCPIPNGVCTGMMVLTVNDPGDDPANPDPFFRPSYLTEPAVFEVWPGHATPTDTPIDPVETGAQCSPSVAELNPVTQEFELIPVPEIIQVSTPFGQGAFSVDIFGVDFSDASGAPPTVTLDGTPLALSFFQGGTGGAFIDQATVQVPAGFPTGPHQLLIANNVTHRTGANGITIQVLGAGDPPPIMVSPPSAPGGHQIQNAIDAAAPGSLIIVQPGTYQENVVIWKPVTLQGYGAGGVVGSPESERGGAIPPGEDPSTQYVGSVIDGRFFTFNQDIRNDWTDKVASVTYGGPTAVAGGAAITVLADPGEFDGYAPRIDGLGITAARGFAGGGIYVHAYGSNLQISNNIIDRNQSAHGGAIALGRPVAEGGDPTDNHNDNVKIMHNRILRNGGVRFAGSIGIFNGADGYQVSYNDICGNASSEYGGGISHFGLSNNGQIDHNRIYYNDAFDEGGGIMIAGDVVDNPAYPPADMLGLGSGNVTLDANLIQANKANDDGGGVQLLRPLAYQIKFTNNIIANNVAADIAGGIALDDASRVSMIANTIAANASTSTAEDRDFSCGTFPISCPHAAGLVSTGNSAAFQYILNASNPSAPTFSDPMLFDNIFWQNEAFFYNPAGGPPDSGLPPNLPSAGFIDMEVFAPDTAAVELMHPKYSLLTVAYAGADNTNIIGVDPLFVAQEETDPVAVPFRLNPNEIIIEYLRITNLSGDYHLQNTSPAINQVTVGQLASFGIVAPALDFDGQTRPFGATNIDIGADETGVAPPPPPPPAVALLFFSTAGDVAIPGVPAGVGAPPYDNADIYKYDSAGHFSRVFDATASGLAAGTNIDAMYYNSAANTFYLSFSPDAGTAVPGVGTVQDEDIVQYNANTGVWSIYFDGSDVGLGSATGAGAAAEDVDAFTLLPNGDVVISTVGNASVTGLAGTFPGQDLLRCSGGTRGANTSCTWSQYFDGSDVALTAGTENIDDVTVFGNNIVLSTTGAYAVPGLSNATASAGADVIVCRGATTGTATACASWSRYFRGSTLGITNNIDGFHSTQDPTTIVVASTAATARVPVKARGRR